MKQTVYLFHGFNVRDGGRRTTDRLRPHLEADGYAVRECDYLWKGLLGVSLCNRSMAKIISGLVEPGSIAIGHSNGCAIIHRAAHYGAEFSRVIYINPALDKNAELAPQIEKALVIACPTDLPVLVASKIPGVIWGGMGRFGYTGNDRRYQTYFRQDECSHSDAFDELESHYPLLFGFMEVSDV